MSVYLDKVNLPQDIKNLSDNQLKILAGEIRDYLIKTVSQNGGHLATNLGVVELTLSLHQVFDLDQDKVIWDVGHQCYTHKLLTGRKELLKTLRQKGGISGFPKREESAYDHFNTGHSSTSLSVALGIAKARDLLGKSFHVIAVIGDGALTGGVALEALNHAGELKTSIIVVLNDNKMSISPNVGGLASYLSRLRSDPKYFRLKEDIEFILHKIPRIGPSVARSAEKIKDSLKYLLVPGLIFEELGFTYLGPVDGHNISALKQSYVSCKNIKGPVLLHVLTKKGQGYKPAENEPKKYHGVGPFDISSGKTLKKSLPSYTAVFSRALLRQAEKNKKIVAITAAM
ncbi:MAG: 1-deoxy-D-xylulose-5-phosphate synthase, partial [Firmicutes bacterium]|nr:1-deoxy-D-xylulose-5-phosphate synthase [Bacillota bacterium]